MVSAGVAWAQIVRTVAATISLDAAGTAAKGLRMVWTLQRCQVAPENTRAIAAFRPACASEITRRTPPRPRVRATDVRRHDHCPQG
jgi:hypothetical protein